MMAVYFFMQKDALCHGKAGGICLEPKLLKLKEWIQHKLQEENENDRINVFLKKIADFSDMMTWKRWAIFGAILFAFAMATCFFSFGTIHHRTSLSENQKIYVRVTSGMSARALGEKLSSLGVIHNGLHFWLRAKFEGYASQFKAGMYAFEPEMDEAIVLEKLVSGETTSVKFTIPEGFGIKEIAERLAEEGLVNKTDFLERAKNFAPYDYMKKEPNVRYAAEGYLFPDTYELHDEVNASAIMKMMAEDFDARLTQDMRDRASEKNLSIHDLITLASLVEKEARFDADRPIIAQVFLKRLKIGMPLQSDTTLQYLMDAPKEDVSIHDTKIESPYNTYQNKGLPPGPIASPGMKSIEAVLHPSDTDYLYFVADHSGHNHYSRTYAEHLSVVDRVR